MSSICSKCGTNIPALAHGSISGKDVCKQCYFAHAYSQGQSFYRRSPNSQTLPPEKPFDCSEDVKHELLAAAGHNFCWRCGSCIQKENPTLTSTQVLMNAIEASLTEFEMIKKNAVLGRRSKSRISNIRASLQNANDTGEKRVHEMNCKTTHLILKAAGHRFCQLCGECFTPQVDIMNNPEKFPLTVVCGSCGKETRRHFGGVNKYWCTLSEPKVEKFFPVNCTPEINHKSLLKSNLKFCYNCGLDLKEDKSELLSRS